MITTIISVGAALLLLMSSHGVIRKHAHILEEKLTIRVWIGSFLALWLGIIIGIFRNAYLAIISKEKMLDLYATVSETQEILRQLAQVDKEYKEGE